VFVIVEKAMLEQVRVRVLPDGRVSREDAAAFLGMKAQTLRNWAVSGRGPRPIKVGVRAFYRLADLEAFRDTGAREAA
jgi:hypothetical protein